MISANSNINKVVWNDLCMGCGICENACNSSAISMIVKNGRFLPQIDNLLCKNSKGCHRCLDACPGIGINLLQREKMLYKTQSSIKNDLLGSHLKCFTGYSTNAKIRERASSGGMISTFLIWLLENNKIDGAVVTRFQKDSPLKVETFIATSKEDILTAKGSKYSPVSLHSILKAIKKAEGNRYIVVGLPCHIHGLRKIMDIDRKLKEKIIGIFSLFCSGSQTFYYTEYILKQCGGEICHLDYLAYREGSPTGMIAKGSNFNFFKEYSRYNMPLKGTFYPRRCLLCVDMFGELADIDFGDIHLKEVAKVGTGINAIVVRSKTWMDLLQEAHENGIVHINEISVEDLLYKRYMASVKKSTNASFVLLLKSLGLNFPQYDSKFYGHIDIKVFIKYLTKRIKQYIGNHKELWFLLPKIK